MLLPAVHAPDQRTASAAMQTPFQHHPLQENIHRALGGEGTGFKDMHRSPQVMRCPANTRHVSSDPSHSAHIGDLHPGGVPLGCQCLCKPTAALGTLQETRSVGAGFRPRAAAQLAGPCLRGRKLENMQWPRCCDLTSHSGEGPVAGGPSQECSACGVGTRPRLRPSLDVRPVAYCRWLLLDRRMSVN